MAHKQFSIDITGCITDPQVQLGAALAAGNIRDFRIALDMGAEPGLADDQHVSVFEKALRTYGCADFVEECLRRGCSPNYVNQHQNKAAINSAADSRDPRILAALLRQSGVHVDRKYAQLTPLNSLAKALSAENAADVVACMRLLLDYGASPNIPDQREMTPLHYVLKNRKIEASRKRELVQMFLQQPDLDVDSYRDGEVRTLLSQEYADLPLPPLPRGGGQAVDCETLLAHLRRGDTDKFLQHFPDYRLSVADKDKLRAPSRERYVPLLVESIKCGAHAALDLLLKEDVDIDVNAVYNGSTPLEVAAVWGNWYALQQLLDHDQLKVRREDQPLIAVIRKLNEQPLQEFCDYRKCFYLLLDSEWVDVNETDGSGSTPLHYAVKYRNQEAIRELLRRGAYIGVRSAFNDLALEAMEPQLLEEHFDYCITSNGRKLGDESFEILINYMNLMPARDATPPGQPGRRGRPRHLPEEMAPIVALARSKEHRHLLQHPLITSFLFLKWHRLSVLFYINFLLYVFFAVSIVTHTILKFRASNGDGEAATALFGLFSWAGIAYMVAREAVQLGVAPANYVRSPTNYLELLLIVLCVMTCIEPHYDRETQRVVAVLAMLLIALELCLLVGSLPVLSISTHMLMLRSVCKTFLKSFMLYSIFVVTFSLCFYILFGKPEVAEVAEGMASAHNATAEGDSFNKFSNPFAAVIKTIVMLTGEFDAGDIEFDSFYSYLLFLLFVFVMTIVLFNLLNGLAVSDTQAIQAQAELNGSICRTNLLARYEEVLTGHSEHAGFLVSREPFRSICRRLMNLYPNYIAGRQIAILPNDNNKVLIPMADSFELKASGQARNHFVPLANGDNERQERRLLDPPIRCLPCCGACLTGGCSEMDRRTVKLAIAVIDQKSRTQTAQQRTLLTERRLQSIEQKLEQLFELLEDMRAK